MTDGDRAATVVATEAWFNRHGLPYFIAENERRVSSALARRRLIPALLAITAAAAAVGVVVGLGSDDVSDGLAVSALVLGLGCLLYAFAYLHFGSIMSWAATQTFGSLNWVFPLVTRALPLLLLFMTFLFINTEVWQVTSALERGYLWLTVMVFGGIAAAFLLVRLPEEVDEVSQRARGEQLVAVCANTPVAALATEVAADESDVAMSRLPKVNLVLVLLFAQAVQVLLLSLSVFAFFILFGLLAIKEEVIEAWLGPDAPHKLPSLDWLPITNELFQVSVFLAAFSGLYFTVYAVTDEKYRQQFFSDIAQELETAVCVQRVYRTLARG